MHFQLSRACFVFLALLQIFAPLARSQTNLIVNGGFESGGIVPGWQWFYNVGQANGFDSAYEGRNFAEVYGTLSQNIPVTPGQAYILSFALSGNFNTPEDTALEVYWAGDHLVNRTSWSSAGHNATNLGWINVEVLVVASAGTNQLRFSNPHIGTQRIPKLDGVRLVPTNWFFELTNTPFVQVRSGAMAWGDYDNDDDLDLVITGNGASTSLYQNNGDGTFSSANLSLPVYRSGSVAWGDYDNDSYLDLLVTGISGNSTTGRVYRNFGGTGFAEVMSFRGVSDGGLSWADFNNDGKLDFAVTGAGPFTQIYQNYYGLAFEPFSSGVYQQYYGGLSWGDYDRDGDVDLLISGSSTVAGTQDGATVYRNDETNGFSSARFFPFESEPGQWLDFDNDGWPDLVLQIWAYQQTRLYRNNRLGGFNLSTNLPIGSYVTGDLNQDGSNDLLIGRTLYANSSQGWTGVPLPILEFDSAALGDFDRDGRLDVVACGQDSRPVTVLYRNTLGPSNSPPTPPLYLSFHSTPTDVVFSWSDAFDAEQASGLTYNVRVGTTPGGFDIVSPMSGASGFRRVARSGNAGTLRSFRLRGLSPGQRCYWSVQAVDNSFAGSTFAPEQSFVVTTPPQISTVTHQAMLEDSERVLPFTIADVETPAVSLDVMATSSNQALFPDQSLRLAGAETERSLTLTPQPNQHGTATITLTVFDQHGGLVTTQFTVTVQPVNDAPVARFLMTPLVVLGTNTFLITRGRDGTLVADGSLSFDVDGQFLQFLWRRDGKVFGTSAAASEKFRRGGHEISLVVSDGQLTGTNSVRFQVVGGCGAVRHLADTVRTSDLPRSRKVRLRSLLEASCRAFNRPRFRIGIAYLNGFQRRVERLVAPLNADLAGLLKSDAEAVVNALRPSALQDEHERGQF